jgi:hypothetical protein
VRSSGAGCHHSYIDFSVRSSDGESGLMNVTQRDRVMIAIDALIDHPAGGVSGSAAIDNAWRSRLGAAMHCGGTTLSGFRAFAWIFLAKSCCDDVHYRYGGAAPSQLPMISI